MKFAPLAALGLAAAAVAMPATAQNAAPAPAPAAPAAAAKFNLDTPIEQLVADQAANAVLAANFGGKDLSQHPAYEQFKSLSLKALAPFSQGMITPEMLAKIEAELAAIK